MALRPTGVLPRLILAVLPLLVLDRNAAYEREEENPPPTGLRVVARDAAYLAKRPINMGRKGKIKLAAVAGTTLLLYALREDIRKEVLQHRNPERSDMLQDVRTMGKGAFAPSVALLAYGGYLLTDNDRDRETAVVVLESAGFSALIAYTGSFVLASERPEEGDEIHFFRTSGHGVSLDAALAASVVPPLRRAYLVVDTADGPWRRFLKRSGTTLLYAGAALAAYQRMDQDKHWAPDVFLGFATGLLVGENLCDAHRLPGQRRFRLQPGASGLTVSIRLNHPGSVIRSSP